jgi:tetratricopeptide (TPR) repeat protein
VKGKDSIGIAITLNNIGNVYQLQGSYTQALEYYEKGL